MTEAALPRPFLGRLLRGAAARIRGREGGFPWLAASVLATVLVCALFGPWIAPHEAGAISLADAMTPPAWEEGGSAEFLLGTDNLGRDILSRIIAGARVSAVVALYAIVISGLIGAVLGMAAGYFGGVVDALISRLIDIQMSVPSIPLAMLFAAVLPPGEAMVIFIIVLSYWTWYARIVRGEVLSLRERDFIALAKIAGVGTPIIFIRHLAPNLLNILLVLATLQFGSVIVFEAGLSFLGPRHPAAAGVLGRDAGRREELHRSRMVANHHPGHRHHGRLPSLESARRLAPRHLRPSSAADLAHGHSTSLPTSLG